MDTIAPKTTIHLTILPIPKLVLLLVMIRRILMPMIIMKTPIVLALRIRRLIPIIQLIKEIINILIIKLSMVPIPVVVTIPITMPMTTTILTELVLGELVFGVLIASIPVLRRQTLVPCLFAVVAVGRRLVLISLPRLHRVLDVVVDPVLPDPLLFLLWGQPHRHYLVSCHEEGLDGL